MVNLRTVPDRHVREPTDAFQTDHARAHPAERKCDLIEVLTREHLTRQMVSAPRTIPCDVRAGRTRYRGFQTSHQPGGGSGDFDKVATMDGVFDLWFMSEVADDGLTRQGAGAAPTAMSCTSFELFAANR